MTHHPMRVLFLAPSAILGGAERAMLDAAVSLRRRHETAETTILLLEDGPLREAAEAEDVPVEVVPLPRRLAALGEAGVQAALRRPGWVIGALVDLARFARSLRLAVRSRAPSIIHTNGMKAHVLALGMLSDWSGTARPQIVIYAHDYLSPRRASRLLLRLLGRQCGAVVANSHAVADDWRSNLPTIEVTPVWVAVDTETFRPGSGDRRRLLEIAGLDQLALESHARIVGLPATFARWKGHRVFLQAAVHLLETAPDLDVRFVIIGGPVYRTGGSQCSRPELDALILELGLRGRAGITGFLAEPAWAMQSLDVVVHASTEPEPFGRVIVEGMACRKPVIVSRGGGANELFFEGETALSFPRGDARALARTLERLLRDPDLAARLAAAGRRHACTYFNRDRLGPELTRVYSRALRRRA